MATTLQISDEQVLILNIADNEVVVRSTKYKT